MGPKPKHNTCLGTVQAPPNSHKCQASSVDQQPTKWTQRTTNNANNDKDAADMADGSFVIYLFIYFLNTNF